VSPRKSSTSSDRPSSRPRYLGIEVAGVQPLPIPALERELARRLDRPGIEVRVIRLEGRRALVRIPHTSVAAARAGWNAPAPAGALVLRTLRSYGTLRKGKAWLRDRELYNRPDRSRVDRV